jgi:catechol 2,3-dioxygenase-like lactoylglutathione lyase family enzyme
MPTKTKSKAKTGAKTPAKTKAMKTAPTAKTAAATKTSAPAKNAPKGKGKPAGKGGSRAVSLTTLGYAIVYVKDMKRGVAFYRDTLGIPVRMADGEWTELEMKGFTLALHRADQMPTNLDKAAVTELCFAADDVRGTRAALAAKGVAISDLHQVCEFGGQVGACGSFRDPDGNHLSIYGYVPKGEWKGGHGEGCC